MMPDVPLVDDLREKTRQLLGIGRHSETYRRRHLEQYEGSLALMGVLSPANSHAVNEAKAEHAADRLADELTLNISMFAGIRVLMASNDKGNPDHLYYTAALLQEALAENHFIASRFDPAEPPLRGGKGGSSRRLVETVDNLRLGMRDFERQAEELVGVRDLERRARKRIFGRTPPELGFVAITSAGYAASVFGNNERKFGHEAISNGGVIFLRRVTFRPEDYVWAHPVARSRTPYLVKEPKPADGEPVGDQRGQAT
jgi:hypothetical protein